MYQILKVDIILKRYLRYLAVLLAAMIMLTVPSFADDITDDYREDAQLLKNIDFMTGDSNGMRLFDELNRAEAAVLLCKIYGAEYEAVYYSHECSFEDVPKWALPYVAFMSSEGVINGRSDVRFDPFASVTMQEFYTMLLRMLGYSDADGDFTYRDALKFAESIGLVSNEDIKAVENRNFLRIDAAHAVVSALRQNCKGTDTPLVTVRAEYIDNSYGMYISDILLGTHEVYDQLEKTRSAMASAGSFTLTQTGRYDINAVDGSYEKDITIDSAVRSDTNTSRAEVEVTVDTQLDGEQSDYIDLDLYCMGSEIFYSNGETDGFMKDNDSTYADVQKYVHIYDKLFGFGSGIVETADIYEAEDGIHIAGFAQNFDIIADITSSSSAKYYFDMDIVIDPETDLIKSVKVTYSDMWTDNQSKEINVDFAVEYVFSKYGSTKVDVPKVMVK